MDSRLAVMSRFGGGEGWVRSGIAWIDRGVGDGMTEGVVEWYNTSRSGRVQYRPRSEWSSKMVTIGWWAGGGKLTRWKRL